MNGIYLLLGTNIGDRTKHLSTAISQLEGRNLQMIKKSSVYESEAWGLEDQQAFLNQVIQINTTMGPHQLLEEILSTERQMGRVRKEKWAERIIDIDILFYHDLHIDSKNLTIPHPYIQERRFTLLPLTELMEEAMHPVLKQSMADLLLQCKDPLAVNKIA